MMYYKIKLDKLLNRELGFFQSIFPKKSAYFNFIDWIAKLDEGNVKIIT